MAHKSILGDRKVGSSIPARTEVWRTDTVALNYQEKISAQWGLKVQRYVGVTRNLQSLRPVGGYRNEEETHILEKGHGLDREYCCDVFSLFR
jgi:hypothetical protein